jgi:hypothetical protein
LTLFFLLLCTFKPITQENTSPENISYHEENRNEIDQSKACEFDLHDPKFKLPLVLWTHRVLKLLNISVSQPSRLKKFSIVMVNYTTSKNKSFLLYGHTNESQHLLHHILIVN